MASESRLHIVTPPHNGMIVDQEEEFMFEKSRRSAEREGVQKSNISHWMAGSCRCFLRAVQSSTAACARRHPSFSSKSCPRQRPAQEGSRFVSVFAESVDRGVELATPPGAPHLASWHHTSIWKRCQRSRSSNMVRVKGYPNINSFFFEERSDMFCLLRQYIDARALTLTQRLGTFTWMSA